MVTPEPPYPLNGGGAFRIASLAHYFAQSADLDLVIFSGTGKAAVLPPGLVRSQTIIPLPFHHSGVAARYFRNARRAFEGKPPLVDRMSGHEKKLRETLLARHYDLGIVEHFWCAPYLEQISRVCERTVLDLHNIESVLHARSVETSSGLVAAGHRRFAACYRKLEEELLPRYGMILAASEPDAIVVRQRAPGARVAIYPNSLPPVSVPEVAEEPVVVFSGNFEYHPNIDAVHFLVNSIWPEVRKKCPELRLRLVGRGDAFIRHLLPSGFDIEVTGAVDDALTRIAAARIVVVPLRAGSGTRIKILEAWAAARPVVATLLAAEGLEYVKDRDLLIANDGPSIAGAIAGLNADPEQRARLASGGRRVFGERYTWQAAWRELSAALATSLPSAGTGTGNRYTEDADANRR
jgi:glycosyltransferase involved in cell wall biosynthesis